jgi:hypothetical protein
MFGGGSAKALGVVVVHSDRRGEERVGALLGLHRSTSYDGGFCAAPWNAGGSVVEVTAIGGDVAQAQLKASRQTHTWLYRAWSRLLQSTQATHHRRLQTETQISYPLAVKESLLWQHRRLWSSKDLPSDGDIEKYNQRCCWKDLPTPWSYLRFALHWSAVLVYLPGTATLEANSSYL